MTRRSNYDLSRIDDELKAKILGCELPWLTRLCELWREIGFDQETVTKRIDTLSMHLDKIWEGLVDEEDEIKSNITKKVELFARDIADLCEELQVAPYEPPRNATLYQLNQIFPTEYKKLKDEKSDRLQAIQKLLVIDDELSDRLGEEGIAHQIDRNKVPSRDDLRTAEKHISTLNENLRKRQAEFEHSRSQILELLEDLGSAPKPNFESDVFCNDENAYDLSEDNLKALQHYREELELIYEERKVKIAELESRFILLWHRLALDEDEKQQILKENNSRKLSVIENFKSQIHRLEQLRIANLECFTSKIRDEIQTWWDKCFFSDDQRQDFALLDDLNYTEPLLDAHEAEVARLREYYDRRMNVFLALENWNQLWDQFVDFEKRANDPNRFSKRGGGLLQEERERRKFAARLPKSEKLVEDEILIWEKENDEEFLIFGFKLKDYIKYVHDQHELEKQQEKDARMRQRRGEKVEPKPPAKAKTPTKRRIGNERHLPQSSQVKTPTKRIKGEDPQLPRSATFTKSPVVSNGNIAASTTPTSTKGSRERIPKMTLTDVVPPPHPGTAKGRLKKTSKTILRNGPTAANSDDVLNGNDAISYEDFKGGVTPTLRSSSMSDLNRLAVSGADAQLDLDSPDSGPVLGTKSFHEAEF